MLDLKLIREAPELVQQRLNTRNGDYDLQPLLALDKQQREMEQQRSQLQARSNEIGKLVGQRIKAGSDPNGEDIQALREEGNQLKQTLSDLEPAEKLIKSKIEAMLLTFPNLPSETTPIGENETHNVEIRRWGDEFLPTSQDILPHYEIGERLGIINTERATKIAQTRFVALFGAGAALERAL
ncbi:MAG: serine--tRNA ligase, partial [Cyanobacteria bacterium]|nr:serine--tRNA ligase [Cyanobacteriota bacterium]MDW8199984.1 serine--tRNA ligase [Cyanobacteriota bacterium SKYGB_h_bin112]